MGFRFSDSPILPLTHIGCFCSRTRLIPRYTHTRRSTTTSATLQPSPPHFESSSLKMSTSRSTSPEVTPKSPRAAEPPYSPPELPFLRDPRGNPLPTQAALTFETMSEEEGFEFLGIKEDFNPVEMLVKIEAAQKEHEKDQVSPDIFRRHRNEVLTCTLSPSLA